MVGDAALEDDEPLGEAMGSLDKLPVNIPPCCRPCHVL